MADECYHKIYVQFSSLIKKDVYEKSMYSQKWKEIVRVLSQDKVIAFHESGDMNPDGKTIYHFDTMRHMVEDSLLKMSSLFSNLDFEIIYHCGSGWYRGFLSLTQGNIVQDRFISSQNFLSCTNESEYADFLSELDKKNSSFIINNPSADNIHGYGSLNDCIAMPCTAPLIKPTVDITIPKPESINWKSHVEIQYETENTSDKKKIIGISVIDDSIWDEG